MYRILLIPLLVTILLLLLLLVAALVGKRRTRSRDKELNGDYIYRKEPHADQVTEHPNRLEDNDITRG
ncbi:hypothetical protein DDZ13_12275 [Coraliomargarita sinensis]|uniref:Uncharacterized protein n=1 Tax=Coraliomargarita sinensis TaxID=2174842 RepID=A0A317ZF45_9BACT|nr:hypothetical protein [Coraliomargarita sinensis]PXA03462.1 hypothetical protein DDZ13_12275 [Coraliomargarita sinensis]